MIVRANTEIEILRGSTTLDSGDVIDTDTPVGDPVAVSLIVQGERTRTEAHQRPQTVEWARIRCNTTLDIRKGDRVRDKRSGHVWLVDSIKEGTTGALLTDTRVTLKRAT